MMALDLLICNLKTLVWTVVNGLQRYPRGAGSSREIPGTTPVSSQYHRKSHPRCLTGLHMAICWLTYWTTDCSIHETWCHVYEEAFPLADGVVAFDCLLCLRHLSSAIGSSSASCAEIRLYIREAELSPISTSSTRCAMSTSSTSSACCSSTSSTSSASSAWD